MPTKHAAHSHAHPDPKSARAHIDRIVSEAEACGLSREAAEAMIGIDASVFAWRRRQLKGAMTREILAALALDIEQSEFEALTAFSRLSYGLGCTKRSEVSIGDIAEELSIDPSRASRLVTALVTKGYIRRALAQDDARKTVLVSTPASQALIRAFMQLKWHLVFDAFKGWTEQDIADFERLFSHYVASMGEAVDRADSNQTGAEQLSESIRTALAAELADR